MSTLSSLSHGEMAVLSAGCRALAHHIHKVLTVGLPRHCPDTLDNCFPPMNTITALLTPATESVLP